MRDVLIIPIMDIDPNWMMRGFQHDFFAFEYCEKALHIPSECIKDALLREDGLEVSLFYTHKLVNKDWYIQLKRIVLLKHGNL